MKKTMKYCLIITTLLCTGLLTARGGGHGGGGHMGGGHMGGGHMGGHGMHSGGFSHGGSHMGGRGYYGGRGYGGYGAGAVIGGALIGDAIVDGDYYDDGYGSDQDTDYNDNQLNYDIDLGEEIIIIGTPENRLGDRKQPISADAIDNRGTSVIAGPDKTFPDISDEPARWEQETYNSPK